MPVLQGFKGIAPRFGDDVKPNFAVELLDCDLSTGKIQPVKSDLQVQSLSSQANFLTLFGSEWLSAQDAYYLQWKINDTLLLIYLEDGVLKRRIKNTVVDMGQNAPDAPDDDDTGNTGNVNGPVRYIITTVREVDGYQDESAPSPPTPELTFVNTVVQVQRPDISDPNVKYWNIYRLGASTTAEYLFVAQVPVATINYWDNIADADLGIACPTDYTSAQGNEIIFAKPPTGIEGIASDLYYGMIVAWKGSTLYFSEPGNPDSWPSIYTINFQSNIVTAAVFAGSLAVLTEYGPQRVDGSNPETLVPGKPLGNTPCLSKHVCVLNNGVCYLSNVGIVIFNLADTQIISLALIEPNWFKTNISNPSTAKLAFSDDYLYLFHSSGILSLDMINKNWEMLSLIAYSIFYNPSDGFIYYCDGSNLKALKQGDSIRTCSYKTGKLKGPDPEANKSFIFLRPTGTGSMTFTVIVDGQEIGSKTITFSARLERDRQWRLPDTATGKALQLQVSGTGTVIEMVVDYGPA